jgi:hypothetical protein
MFHFTIRDALWLTALVAVGLGWWIDRSRRAETTRPVASSVKYDLIVTGKDADKLYLLDARTGQMWERYGDGQWISFAKFPDE